MKATARKRLVQEYYSRRAKDYDRQKIRTWNSKQGFGAKVLEGLIDSLAGLKDKRVLGACVGTGRTGLPLLEKVKPWLIGLDLSREMLSAANTKLSLHKDRFNLAMGDAENLPFKDKAFDALICTSALHYFASPEKSLGEFSRVLCMRGVFVYGDLTLHELDNRGFLNKLERTVSHTHEGYLKPSEINNMLGGGGFIVSSINTVAYRKPFNSLIEDKAKYFGVKPEALQKCLCNASAKERELYALSSDELTLYYTLIKSMKEA
jgi:ubiquinone/menaquinone biosynthesis C-methylase UbiE